MDLKVYFELGKAFLSGFVGAGSFIVIYHLLHVSPPQIGSVNVNRLVNEHIKHRAISNLSAKDLHNDSQQFMTKLELAMQELAKRENLSLIVSDAVVFGPKDYTDVIRRSMEVAQ